MKQTSVDIQLLNKDYFPQQKNSLLSPSVVGEDGTLSLQGSWQIRAMPQLQNVESIAIRDKQLGGP